jgi:hypothetical protein
MGIGMVGWFSIACVVFMGVIAYLSASPEEEIGESSDFV